MFYIWVCGACVAIVQQEFDDARDADDAVYDLNGKSLCGERLLLHYSSEVNAEDIFKSEPSLHILQRYQCTSIDAIALCFSTVKSTVSLLELMRRFLVLWIKFLV